MPLALHLKSDDKITPLVHELSVRLENRTGLHRLVADEWEVLIRGHITSASASRHTTAQRLGASPTGYLEAKAAGVESSASDSGAEVIVPGDIFARVNGPVTVTAKAVKNLAIPANRPAFGRRPAEVGNLTFVFFKSKGVKALVRFTGKGKARQMDVFFWLKPSVVLPQDRGLLPGDEKLLDAAESGAEKYVQIEAVMQG